MSTPLRPPGLTLEPPQSHRNKQTSSPNDSIQYELPLEPLTRARLRTCRLRTVLPIMGNKETRSRSESHTGTHPGKACVSSKRVLGFLFRGDASIKSRVRGANNLTHTPAL